MAALPKIVTLSPTLRRAIMTPPPLVREIQPVIVAFALIMKPLGVPTSPLK